MACNNQFYAGGMKRTMKLANGLLLIPIALLLTACLETGNSDSGTPPATGSSASSASSSSQADMGSMSGSAADAVSWGNAPDFSYALFSGEQNRISSHLGKPLVVNFWAVW